MPFLRQTNSTARRIYMAGCQGKTGVCSPPACWVRSQFVRPLMSTGTEQTSLWRSLTKQCACNSESGFGFGNRSGRQPHVSGSINIVGIAHSYPESTAAETAVADIARFVKLDRARWGNAHRKWWHEYYPQSFISIPDKGLECVLRAWANASQSLKRCLREFMTST